MHVAVCVHPTALLTGVTSSKEGSNYEGETFKLYVQLWATSASSTDYGH